MNVVVFLIHIFVVGNVLSSFVFNGWYRKPNCFLSLVLHSSLIFVLFLLMYHLIHSQFLSSFPNKFSSFFFRPNLFLKLEEYGWMAVDRLGVNDIRHTPRLALDKPIRGHTNDGATCWICRLTGTSKGLSKTLVATIGPGNGAHRTKA